MAILSVTGPLGPGMTISDSLSDGATGTVVFRVISDDPNESPAVVMNANGVPVLGTAYPGAPDVLLTNKSPDRQASDASNTVWLVTCNYSSILSKEQRDRMDHKNPLDRKCHIYRKSQKIMKPFRVMKRGYYYQLFSPSFNPVIEKLNANSAGDFFEPLLEYPATEWIYCISKNVDSFPDFLDDYEDAVNDADFTITAYGKTRTVKKGCGKMGNIAIPISKQENGQEYVAMSFEIIVRTPRGLREGESVAPEPWDDEIPDMGMRTYEDANDGTAAKAWKNVEDIDGNGITLPVPFDGKGKPVGTPGDGRIEETDFWLSLVRPYPRKSFAALAAYMQ